jgi:1,4-dihydroxy-2-naphthoate octaprenyltransferase
VYGINNSNLVYTIFTTAVCVLILIYVTLNIIPPLSLIALVPMPLAYYSLSGAIRHGEKIGHFPKYLAANTAVTLLAPLLLGLSIIIG